MSNVTARRMLLGAAMALVWVLPSARAEISPEAAAKVQAALPAEARAIPKYPRKLLVFTLCKGFVHSSIPLAAEAMKWMGAKTGAYEAVISDDPAVFAANNLAQYDAVLFDNTTGTLFAEPELRDSLMSFVKGGRGVIGVHAATDCFYDWPEYGEMMGGYFDGHPWGADTTVTLRIDDPLHPLNAAFHGQGFAIQDEIYQFRDPYSRNNLRVLLTLDPNGTDMARDGMKRADKDYAVSWLRAWGQGRVFYCSLGHNESVFWNPAVLAHYLDGIQYALGDLDADATPSALLSPAYFEKSSAKAAQFREKALIDAVKSYTAGQDAAALNSIAERVAAAQTQPAERAIMESMLIGLLNEAVTLDAKQFACKQLYVLGADASVPVLGEMLKKPETADMARYALERSSSPLVDEVLLKALSGAQGLGKIGIINSLGQRHTVAAIPALTECLKDSCPDVVPVALAALGHIPDEAACNALIQCRQMDAALQAAVDEAVLTQAAQQASASDEKLALSLYRDVFWNGMPQSRGAALRGLVLCGSESSVALIDEAMRSYAPEMRVAAAMAVRDRGESRLAADLVPKLSNWDSAAQVLLLQSLRDTKERVASPLIRGALRSTDESVLLAALAGLPPSADPSLVAVAVPFLTGSSEGVAKAAREALAAMPGRGITEVLAAEMGKAHGSIKAELARALSARRSPQAAEALLAAAADPDKTVRIEIYRALAAIGTRVQAQPMLTLLLAEQDAEARGPAEGALAAALVQGGVELVLQAFDAQAANPELRASLIRALGLRGDDRAVGPIAAALMGSVPAERQAALEAFGQWPTAAPAPAMIEAAAKLEDPAQRSTAWQAAIQLLAKGGEVLTPADQLAAYTKALELAQNPDQKGLVLAGVAAVHHPEVITFIKTCAGVPELERDVTEALERATVLKYTDTGQFPILKSKDLACDGDLGEWRRFTTQLKDESKGLNAAFRVEWTDEGLWIAAEVFDRSVVVGGTPETLWERDSIQLAVDPLGEKGDSKGPNTIELGIEQTESGAQVYAWYLAKDTDPALIQQVVAVVKRQDPLTIYEVKIPWAVLAPFVPQPDKGFGFDIAVNDLDEKRPWAAIEWTPGILQEKKPSAYKTVVLVGDL